VSSRLNQSSTDKIAAAEKELAQLESKYAEIAAEAGLAAASMLPPPAGTIADAVSLGKSVMTGAWGGALLDVVGFVPLFGDAAKAAGKGTTLVKRADALKTAIKAKKGRLRISRTVCWQRTRPRPRSTGTRSRRWGASSTTRLPIARRKPAGTRSRSR
jgi:hypothetical protein